MALEARQRMIIVYEVVEITELGLVLKQGSEINLLFLSIIYVLLLLFFFKQHKPKHALNIEKLRFWSSKVDHQDGKRIFPKILSHYHVESQSLYNKQPILKVA